MHLAGRPAHKRQADAHHQRAHASWQHILALRLPRVWSVPMRTIVFLSEQTHATGLASPFRAGTWGGVDEEGDGWIEWGGVCGK